MATILVTGATGFLGSRLCQRLIQKGHRVIGTGRNLKKGAELAQWGVPFESIDLATASEERLQELLKNVDQVVHSAALASSWGTRKDFESNNVTATQNLRKAAQKAGVRTFVYISSPSVYVCLRDSINIKESDPLPLHQLSYYGETKLRGENDVLQANSPNFATVALRPQGLLGAGDNVVMPKLISLAKTGLPKVRKDSTLIDCTHVENVVDAIELALNAGEQAYGKVFNISNQQPMDFHMVAKLVCEKLGVPFKIKKLPRPVLHFLAVSFDFGYKALQIPKEPPVHLYSYSLLAHHRTLNCDLAQSLLGYKPNRTIQEALDEFCIWYQTVTKI
jgi:nucleoside-diphosphate-sugar epimerase